jgi:hypothetical protein
MSNSGQLDKSRLIAAATTNRVSSAARRSKLRPMRPEAPWINKRVGFMLTRKS